MFNSDEPSFTPHGFLTETRFLPGRGMAKMPKIFISREAYTLMALYVELGDQEVGWLGTAIRQEDGDFRIEKVFLFKQQVSGTETEISTEGLQELSMELIGRGDEGIKDWNNMRFWGHSHVRMGTFASGTDENTMIRNRFGGGALRDRLFCFQDSDYPWAIRGIFNKLGRAQFSLFLYEEGLRLDDVPWEVDAPTASTPEPEAAPVVVDLPALAHEAGLATGWTPASTTKVVDAGLVPNAVAPGVASVGDIDSIIGAAPDAVAAPAANTGESSLASGGSNLDTAPNTVASGGSSGASTSNAVEEKPKPWLKRVFSRPPRDRRYTPDITADLRRTVEAEFRSKVKSRYVLSGFRSFAKDEKDGDKNGGPESGGNVNDGFIVDGEASGPGMFHSGRSGEDGGAAKRTTPGSAVCPASNNIPKYGCNCTRCMTIRREQNKVVAPTFFAPPPSRHEQQQYADPQESIIVTLGRAFFEWLGR